MSTHNIPFQYKKITSRYPKSAAMGFVPKGLKTSSNQPWCMSHQCWTEVLNKCNSVDSKIRSSVILL